MIPEVKEALDAFAAADLIGMSMDASVGGAQLPVCVAQAGFAWHRRGQREHVGLRDADHRECQPAQRVRQSRADRHLRGADVAGRFTGTMALSETQAGSSLADITTRAEPQDDGTHRLSGSKMWISGAEHEMTDNIINLVLAKIPGGPAGTKGISLFVVPKFLPTAPATEWPSPGSITRWGQRGITNTVLNLDDAVGYLVGEPHRGLYYKFHMMNEARLGRRHGRGGAGIHGLT